MATKKTKTLTEVVEKLPVQRKTKIKERTQELIQSTGPTVVVGSHLTVTTYPDGRTELKWDDEALLNDVRQAISNYKGN